MNTPLNKQAKSLHKKLIPVNIIVAAVSLVAALCLLFMPWLDLRIHVAGDQVAALLNENSPSSKTEYVSSEEISTSKTQEEQLMEALSKEISTMQFDIPINIYPIKMYKAAKGTQVELEEFINSLIGKNGAAEFLSDFINTLAPVVLKTTVHITIDTAVEEALIQAGVEITPEQKEQIEGYKETASVIITDLLAEEVDTEKVKADFSSLVNQIAIDYGEEAPDPEQLNQVFDAIVDQGINEDGTFDLTHLLKNFDLLQFEQDMENATGNNANSSENNSDSAENSQESSKEISVMAFAMPTNTQSDLDSGMDSSILEDSSSTDNSGEETVNELNEIIAFLENPGGVLVQSMAEDENFEEDLATLQDIFLSLFILMAAIPAFFWALLAINAFKRIFTKRKVTRTWYVRLFCFWSGFGLLLGNFGLSYLPQVIPETAEILSTFTFEFLGSGIVAGICWLVIAVCGIFYRKTKKKLRYAHRISDEEFDAMNAKPTPVYHEAPHKEPAPLPVKEVAQVDPVVEVEDVIETPAPPVEKKERKEKVVKIKEEKQPKEKAVKQKKLKSDKDILESEWGEDD